MKKLLWGLLSAMLSFFMFAGISQAGDCIYLGSGEVSTGTVDLYYDSSDVQYSGDIVGFVLYGNDACEEDEFTGDVEIDCARRMHRYYDKHWSEWESFDPGSILDVTRQELCR